MKPSQERKWIQYYDKGADELVLPKKTLFRYLKDECVGYEKYIALDYYGKKITYGEFFNKIDKTANAFKALGINKGEHVVFLTANFPETLISFYALNKIGAIPTLVEPRMGKDRIDHFISMVKAKTLIIVDMVYPKIFDLIDKNNVEHVLVQHPTDSLPFIKSTLKKIITKKIDIPYKEDKRIMHFKDFTKLYDPNNLGEEVSYVNDSVCCVTQTGGTTGIPKGVELKNDGLNAVALSFKYSKNDCRPGDKFLNIMPIFTSYGVVCGVHMALTQKVINILVPDFKPKMFAGLIVKHHPQSTIAVPSFYEMFINSRKARNVDLSRMIFAVSGGDVMTSALEDQVNKFFKEHGCKYHVCQGYGLSETSAVTCFSNNYRKRSEGVPLCTSTMGIFDPDTGEELDYYQKGEICITGPSIMKGYYNNPEETNNVMRLHSDGRIWVHSGDLGYFDEDGFLYFEGRIKFVIPRFDGHKNFPVQIEKCVSKHQDVLSVACVACKDLDHATGMYPLVVVELKDKTVDKARVRVEILALCAKILEERGQPIDVVFEDSMPMTLVGKIDVTSLNKKYANYNYKKDN